MFEYIEILGQEVYKILFLIGPILSFCSNDCLAR